MNEATDLKQHQTLFFPKAKALCCSGRSSDLLPFTGPSHPEYRGSGKGIR